ncbi:hypothetical protein AMS68_002334 [Peltaster fructicola]|uniref:tetrahydrofolate synthase n=1 Tax=Peltaster fructicola TaxID=286661 RepID=A0A6H0XPX9_9PEZI|nr:hypothetical protein AMS68_002334 [Peltaster fructicola]
MVRTSSFNESAGNYQEALRLLANRRRQARPARSSREEQRPSPVQHVTPDLRGRPSIVGMRRWLQLLGHSDADIKALNVIHVAGTKGKGSTCAFTEVLLRTHGRRTGFPSKLGLYTSPHLISPLERIRINFDPLSEDRFAEYFFEVYRTLEHSREVDDFDKAPRYLQLWALVAFHAFIKEKVDVAIIETHHGGEYDATNFVEQPAVTVVTTLGMDHVDQLGPTLSNIAWHKAGIFKPGAMAITAPQANEAVMVLQQRAAEKNVALEVASIGGEMSKAMAGLPAEVLRVNCSVALLASNAYLQTVEQPTLTPSDIVQGIAEFAWPGRFQQLREGQRQWYLDAAHNELSMEKAAQWFSEATRCGDGPDKSNILVFSHISSNRDGGKVLRSLLGTLKAHKVDFVEVILTTYARSAQKQNQNNDHAPGTLLQTAESVSELWKTYSEILLEHYPDAKLSTVPTIDAAVRLVQTRDATRIFATGSQHLLGGILQILPDGRS